MASTATSYNLPGRFCRMLDESFAGGICRKASSSRASLLPIKSHGRQRRSAEDRRPAWACVEFQGTPDRSDSTGATEVEGVSTYRECVGKPCCRAKGAPEANYRQARDSGFTQQLEGDGVIFNQVKGGFPSISTGGGLPSRRIAGRVSHRFRDVAP